MCPAITLNEALYHLLDDVGPMTSKELVRLTGRTPGGVRDSIRRLRAKKMVYITRYELPESRGRRSPVYAVGSCRNASEGAFTQRERDKKYRAKMGPVIRARDAVRQGREVSVWKGLL